MQMPQITRNRAIRALAPSPHIQTQERKIADTPAAVTSSASGWNRSCRKVPAPPKRFSALTMTEAGTSSRARTLSSRAKISSTRSTRASICTVLLDMVAFLLMRENGTGWPDGDAAGTGPRCRRTAGEAPAGSGARNPLSRATPSTRHRKSGTEAAPSRRAHSSPPRLSAPAAIRCLSAPDWERRTGPPEAAAPAEHARGGWTA